MKNIVKQKITPFLWFDDKAEEAINLYISVFKNGKIKSITRYNNDAIPGMEGKVLTAVFELFGQEFLAFDAGPQFKFNEAISLMVRCTDQDEVDDLWTKLTKDGEESMCGWLKDKYGLSWQIVPTALPRMLRDPDPAKVKRVMEAMMKMRKIDTNILQQAYDGKPEVAHS